jgi:tetratricopeptide (TPR) repeat protein
MAPFINPFLFALSLFPILYLSILAHELGHAVLGTLSGAFITSFGLGTARPWLVLKRGRTCLFLCRKRPLQGVTFACWPQLLPAKWRRVAYCGGGVVANGLLLFISLGLWRWARWGDSIWVASAYVNGVFAVTSLIPTGFRVGNAAFQTDGALILRTLLSRGASLPPSVTIQSLDALRGLWESTGDRVMLLAKLLGCAEAWIELRDFERAERVHGETAALLDVGVPALRGLAALLASSIASGRGRLGDAAEALAEAERVFRGLNHEPGLFMTELQKAQLRVRSGDVQGGLAEWERLTDRPLVKKWPLLRLGLLEARLMTAAELKDLPLVERALLEYERLAARQPSAARTLRVYRALATLAAQRQNWDHAETYFRKAIAAIDRIASTWVDAAERERFLVRESEFLQGARGCFEAQRKEDEARRLIDPLLSVEVYNEVLAKAPVRRDKRLLRIACWVMLADLIALASLSGIWSLLGREAGIAAGIVAFEYAVFGLLALVYLVFHVALGRLIPGLRTAGGAVTLMLASLPWLALAMLPVLYLVVKAR